MTVPLARQWVKERAIAICEFAVFVARFARQWTKEQGNVISEFVFFLVLLWLSSDCKNKAKRAGSSVDS